MLRTIITAGLCVALFTGCAHRSRSQRPATRAMRRAYEREAREAALQWLELLDAGNYQEAFEREPARLQAGGTVRQFTRSMRARRAPFGRALSRTLIGTGYSRRLTGAPDANYESLLFKSSFQHKATAAERVIVVDDHGTWRVVDYRLY